MVKGFINYSGYKIPFVIEKHQMDLFTDDSVLTDFIKEYNIWQTAVRRVYATFDAEGMNKSFFVLQKIRSFYLAEKTSKQGDALFDAVRKDVKNEIINHADSNELSYESVDICTDVLVVDSFIRCKIFENPKGYNYVTA